MHVHLWKGKKVERSLFRSSQFHGHHLGSQLPLTLLWLSLNFKSPSMNKCRSAVIAPFIGAHRSNMLLELFTIRSSVSLFESYLNELINKSIPEPHIHSPIRQKNVWKGRCLPQRRRIQSAPLYPLAVHSPGASLGGSLHCTRNAPPNGSAILIEQFNAVGSSMWERSLKFSGKLSGRSENLPTGNALQKFCSFTRSLWQSWKRCEILLHYEGIISGIER